MKKILNSANTFMDESLEDIVQAHGDSLKFSGADHRVVIRSDSKRKIKVSTIPGGGYGHLPIPMSEVIDYRGI